MKIKYLCADPKCAELGEAIVEALPEEHFCPKCGQKCHIAVNGKPRKIHVLNYMIDAANNHGGKSNDYMKELNKITKKLGIDSHTTRKQAVDLAKQFGLKKTNDD